MTKMQIVLFSDNHGEATIIPYLKNTYPQADAIVHCGDSCLPPEMMQGIVSVEGNNDPYHAYPESRILHYASHAVYVCHSHRDMLFGRYDMLAEKARENNCDTVFFGHTHIPYDKTIKGVHLINPGSTWHNRDGSETGYMLVTFTEENVKAERILWHAQER